MIYELNQEGLAIAVTDILKAIQKEHDTPPYTHFVDPLAVYNNLEQVTISVEKYQKRIKRKNADKYKAYALLLWDIWDYKVFKHTAYGKREFDEILAKIKNIGNKKVVK